MRTEGWKGKGRSAPVPQWKLEARRLKTIQVTAGYSQGGLPRRRSVAPITLPRLSCLEVAK